jgi:hypothetical protein
MVTRKRRAAAGIDVAVMAVVAVVGALAALAALLGSRQPLVAIETRIHEKLGQLQRVA